MLEVGAGTGFAGICAALLGADVMLTDTASCMPLLVQNINSHCSSVAQAGGLSVARLQSLPILSALESGHVCRPSPLKCDSRGRRVVLPSCSSKPWTAGGSVEACILDWSEADDSCLARLEGYQIILGADLVYNKQGVAQLLATLTSLLRTSPNMQLLLGHCSRHVLVDELLFAGLDSLGFALTRVASSEKDARVSIYRHLPHL